MGSVCEKCQIEMEQKIDSIKGKDNKSWNSEKLMSLGYELQNAKITNVDLSMKNFGCIFLTMSLETDSGIFQYDNYSLGHGYLGADEFNGDEWHYSKVIDFSKHKEFKSIEITFYVTIPKNGDRLRQNWMFVLCFWITS